MLLLQLLVGMGGARALLHFRPLPKGAGTNHNSSLQSLHLPALLRSAAAAAALFLCNRLHAAMSKCQSAVCDKSGG
jgi:hypothetical protein